MFNSTENYQNKFFINSQELPGIDSLSVSYDHQASVINPVGFAYSTTTVNGPVQQKVSFSRSLIYQDPILNYASVPITGGIVYNNQSYIFNSGYLDEYMVDCAVGSIPRVSTNITVYDEMKKINSPIISNFEMPSISIPNQGSVFLYCDKSSTNRVSSFSLSIKFANKPLYSIGSKMPTKVVKFEAIQYSLTVEIDVDDAFMSNALDFLNNAQLMNVDCSILGRDNQSLFDISIPNASLVSENINSSADGGIKLTLKYMGHL